uniref:Ribonuclease PIN domain-containing protein n=1 Tax=Amphimedon queenslandica TaxID=400682 RepID=A0A1X7U4L1_AMPQE
MDSELERLYMQASVQDWSQTVYTIRDVISEIKDSETRQRLQLFIHIMMSGYCIDPLDAKNIFNESVTVATHDNKLLTARSSPHQRQIKAQGAIMKHSMKTILRQELPVTDFSKKTGDYQSLSAVDLRLIALNYQLEKERGPQRGTNLRTDPIQTNKEQQGLIIIGNSSDVLVTQILTHNEATLSDSLNDIDINKECDDTSTEQNTNSKEDREKEREQDTALTNDSLEEQLEEEEERGEGDGRERERMMMIVGLLLIIISQCVMVLVD